MPRPHGRGWSAFPLLLMKLQGIFISVATPFNHRGEVWQNKVEHNVVKWNRTSVAGYVVGGAASENVSLSSEEKARMLDLVKQYAAPEKLVIAAADLPGLIENISGMSKVPGLCESDAHFAASLAAGASGIISTIANAAPYTMISIWEAHRTRDTEAANDWQSRIAKAVETINRPSGIAALKYAMDVNGYYGGPPRFPVTMLTPGQKKEVEQAFAGIKG
jgi:dihydrodipicolinate synthase/N-acetylneuraminate lyase